MLIIYTGNGKGKTTASFGLALRASGYGLKVCILQFVKQKSWPEGARKAIREHLPNIEIQALGSGWVGIMGDKKPLSEHKHSAQKAVQMAIDKINSGKYNVIILDELLGTLHGKLISKKDVENILLATSTQFTRRSHGESGQPAPDLVLTGRHAPAWLIKKADLVTEMKEIKHPFQQGIQAKRGIDF